MRANITEYMDIFVHVVESGSFIRAAEQLQMHRPAVSKALQQLEEELGVKLLHRTTRKLSLTSEGEAFYQRAKVLLGEMADLMATYSSTQSVSGSLRLDFPLTLAHSMLIPALGEFRERYPDIEIILTSSDRRIDLIAEGIDCVVRLGELEDSSFIARRIGEVAMVTCAAPSYLTKYGAPQTLDDLAQHKAVNFFSDRSREVMTWKFIVNGEIIAKRVDSALRVDNSDIFLTSGLAGLGLIQGVDYALRPYIESGALVTVLPDYACAPKAVSVLYPDKRNLAPRVRVFIDWFSELFSR
ncbi:LysR substrate-binding domain-containing protein [Kluyvera sp. 142486]|uniref:LysR substrate-binding domain-containing protein n=1 Tax=Kluyvera sp. 142486 TaxID=3390050 RepID=UPI00397EBCB9